jgi:hypothetical protein
MELSKPERARPDDIRDCLSHDPRNPVSELVRPKLLPKVEVMGASGGNKQPSRLQIRKPRWKIIYSTPRSRKMVRNLVPNLDGQLEIRSASTFRIEKLGQVINLLNRIAVEKFLHFRVGNACVSG